MRRARLHTPVVSGRMPGGRKNLADRHRPLRVVAGFHFWGEVEGEKGLRRGKGKEKRDVNGKERREWIIRWLYLG